MKLLLLLGSYFGQTLAGNFVDDKGTIHDIPKNALIVTGAMDAVAFHHFGMKPNQIIATIGERSSSGSNHGGQYADGNLVYAELSHGETPYDQRIFPADPDKTERAFLDLIPGDLSPGCSALNYYCDTVELDYIDKNGWPDYFVVGSFYSSLINDDIRAKAETRNVPIIELTNTYSSDEGASSIRDMVTMVDRMEELALALGVKESNSVVQSDKLALCRAADIFQEIAQEAHDNGVRTMASYMPYNPNPQGMTGAFLPNPDRDPVLSLMQNLGLPILYNEHSGSYWENRAGKYRPNEGTLSASATTSLSGIPYNVDFWLYDDRVSLDFLSDQFALDWPHPAIVAKQYAYWPSNARILSYRHAAEILTIVGNQLDGAKRVSLKSKCVISDDSTVTERLLAPGEYSCYKVVPIHFCVNRP